MKWLILVLFISCSGKNNERIIAEKKELCTVIQKSSLGGVFILHCNYQDFDCLVFANNRGISSQCKKLKE
jgi:hypothetical protein